MTSLPPLLSRHYLLYYDVITNSTMTSLPTPVMTFQPRYWPPNTGIDLRQPQHWPPNSGIDLPTSVLISQPRYQPANPGIDLTTPVLTSQPRYWYPNPGIDLPTPVLTSQPRHWPHNPGINVTTPVMTFQPRYWSPYPGIDLPTPGINVTATSGPCDFLVFPFLRVPFILSLSSLIQKARLWIPVFKRWHSVWTHVLLLSSHILWSIFLTTSRVLCVAPFSQPIQNEILPCNYPRKYQEPMFLSFTNMSREWICVEIFLLLITG